MQSDDVVEAVARALIVSSAGHRAADHAREFDTITWREAKRDARAAITAHDTALKQQVETLREEILALRGSSTNNEGLLPCPKCHSVDGPHLYWWTRGQAWLVICGDCKHEAHARETHEYQARDIWNDEATTALAVTDSTYC